MDFVGFPQSEFPYDEPRDRAVQQIAQLLFQLVRYGSRRAAQALAKYDLTISQYHTLAYLRFCRRPCTMGELAEAVLQDGATMTGIVDRLAQRGLVHRAHDRADRRVVYVTLQEPGQEIVEQVTLAWYQRGMVILNDLDQEMLDRTVHALQMILDHLQSESD